jgi:MFS family permease
MILGRDVREASDAWFLQEPFCQRYLQCRFARLTSTLLQPKVHRNGGTSGISDAAATASDNPEPAIESIMMDTPQTTPKSTPYLKLMAMMVLEFFIWGAWLPLIFGYLPSLAFSAAVPPKPFDTMLPSSVAWFFSEQSLILNAFPFAAIVGMFFSNQFADRNFAAERFLSFSHLVGGLAILSLGWVTTFWPFFLLMLVHCLLYVPTISITNSIAFTHLKDAKREFGVVRMGGTIGWILAAWPFVFILVDWERVQSKHPVGFSNWLGTAFGTPLVGDALKQGTRWTFVVSGAASLLLAAFSLVLPHTPPKRADELGTGGHRERLAWLEALKVLRHPFLLVLWIVTLIDAFVHNCYFNWTAVFLQSDKVGIPGNWVTPVMSIGQVAEILTMVILGPVLTKLGWKTTMIVGVLGHAARFATYAYFPEYPWLIILIQVLHGICYAFFFATVYIFVDEYLPKDARSSAQGLFNLMILGVGVLLANAICPYLLQSVYVRNRVVDFHGLFLIPLGLALGAAVLLLVFFWPPRKEAVPEALQE